MYEYFSKSSSRNSPRSVSNRSRLQDNASSNGREAEEDYGDEELLYGEEVPAPQAIEDEEEAIDPKLSISYITDIL